MSAFEIGKQLVNFCKEGKNLESITTIERMIEGAGFQPHQRNSWYGIVDERHKGERGPLNREDARLEFQGAE